MKGKIRLRVTPFSYPSQWRAASQGVGCCAPAHAATHRPLFPANNREKCELLLVAKGAEPFEVFRRQAPFVLRAATVRVGRPRREGGCEPGLDR